MVVMLTVAASSRLIKTLAPGAEGQVCAWKRSCAAGNGVGTSLAKSSERSSLAAAGRTLDEVRMNRGAAG